MAYFTFLSKNAPRWSDLVDNDCECDGEGGVVGLVVVPVVGAEVCDSQAYAKDNSVHSATGRAKIRRQRTSRAARRRKLLVIKEIAPPRTSE